MGNALVGLGNPYRRDDGIGPALVDVIRRIGLPGVRLRAVDGDPTQLLDAWSGARLVVVVDAVMCDPTVPGRIRRATADQIPGSGVAPSTHGIGIPEALRLANVLGRAPDRLVVYAVDAADVGFGRGLSPAVADALPPLARAVLAEFRSGRPRDARPSGPRREPRRTAWRRRFARSAPSSAAPEE
jgi:hydrogenase maturation protease